MDESDTETYAIEGPEGDTASVELPAGLVDVLSETDEDPSEVVADVVLVEFAQRAHVITHHSEEDASREMQAINETAEELFEERFGRSLQDALGHEH